MSAPLGQMPALRKALGVEGNSYLVGQRVCQRANTLGKAEYEKYGGIDAQRDGGIATFDTGQGIAANKGELGDNSHCQPTSFACGRNILSKLSARLSDRQWQRGGQHVGEGKSVAVRCVSGGCRCIYK